MKLNINFVFDDLNAEFLLHADIMDSDKAQIVSETSDVETVEEEEMDTTDKSKLSEALRNPQVMAALQARLDSLVGDPSGYIKVMQSNLVLTVSLCIMCCIILVIACKCSKEDQSYEEPPACNHQTGG